MNPHPSQKWIFFTPIPPHGLKQRNCFFPTPPSKRNMFLPPEFLWGSNNLFELSESCCSLILHTPHQKFLDEFRWQHCLSHSRNKKWIINGWIDMAAHVFAGEWGRGTGGACPVRQYGTKTCISGRFLYYWRNCESKNMQFCPESSKKRWQNVGYSKRSRPKCKKKFLSISPSTENEKFSREKINKKMATTITLLHVNFGKKNGKKRFVFFPLWYPPVAPGTDCLWCTPSLLHLNKEIMEGKMVCWVLWKTCISKGYICLKSLDECTNINHTSGVFVFLGNLFVSAKALLIIHPE